MWISLNTKYYIIIYCDPVKNIRVVTVSLRHMSRLCVRANVYISTSCGCSGNYQGLASLKLRVGLTAEMRRITASQPKYCFVSIA